MPLSPSEFEQIRKIVQESSGIVLDPGKQMMVEQKLKAVAEELGKGSPDAVAREVISSPRSSTSQSLVEALITPETGFFRDNRSFMALKEAVLPSLIEKRAATRTLNLWSAGCSSGQEPYSILMMMQENFPQLKGWTIRFIASDISTKVLSKAREGSYSQLEMNRGLPAPLLLKYFQKSGLQWQLKPALRSMVEFRDLNLVKPWPPLPSMDIIFMRNVLVYFQPDTKRKILEQVAGKMNKDGYLFMGLAEIPMTPDNRFQKFDYDRSGCFILRS